MKMIAKISTERQLMRNTNTKAKVLATLSPTVVKLIQSVHSLVNMYHFL